MFAVLLLVWTTADLCGHGVCAHDREPLLPGLPTGTHADTSVGQPGAPPNADPSNGPDDCFCCCHCVDVQVPFELPLVHTVVASLLAEHLNPARLAPSSLYHPPLA